MRAGNYGLLSLGMLTASLAISAGYGDWLLSEQAGKGIRGSDPAPPRTIPVPQAVQQAMGELRPRLARLAIPAEPPDRSVDLRLVGYEPVRYPSGRGPRSGPATGSDPFPFHTLSMAFLSPQHSFCVIDDQFHALGETLADGSRITQIRHGRVQLGWQGIREWLEVHHSVVETASQEEHSIATAASQ